MQSLTVCLRYLKIALPTRVLGSVASAALASARAAALDVERNKSCSKAIATAQGDDAVLIGRETYLGSTGADRNNRASNGGNPDAVAASSGTLRPGTLRPGTLRAATLRAGTLRAGKTSRAVDSRDIIVRKLTVVRIHALDSNDAGSRTEQQHSKAGHVSFINNQDRIPAAPHLDSTVIVRDSTPGRNAACGHARPHRVYVNRRLPAGSRPFGRATRCCTLGSTFIDLSAKVDSLRWRHAAHLTHCCTPITPTGIPNI